MGSKKGFICWMLAASSVALLANVSLAEDDAVYELREVTVFGGSAEDAHDAESLSDSLRYGVVHLSGNCIKTPQQGVVYPRLNSPSPLYCYIQFGPTVDDVMHLVIDEAKLAETATEESGPTLFGRLAGALTRKSTPAKSVAKYDLLYCDINGDRDLTNDPPLSALAEPPRGFAYAGPGDPSTKVFDCLEWKPSDGGPSSRFLPWLRASSRSSHIYFTSTTFRKGRIQVYGEWYEAFLRSSIRGALATIMIKPEKAAAGQSSTRWQNVPLGALQQSAKGLYTVSLAPGGHGVTVSPYRGEFGEFRFTAADASVQKLGIAGSLLSKENSSFWIGDLGNYYTNRPRQCQLPVGDYRPGYLYAECGNTVVRLGANNYYLPDRSQDPAAKKPVYGITISQDKPFQFKFSRRPSVLFISPANEEQVFHRGDKISLKALVLDPELDVMIRGLYDATQTIGQQSTRNQAGETVKIPRYASLVPTMSITNSSGKEVVRGTMPFG